MPAKRLPPTNAVFRTDDGTVEVVAAPTNTFFDLLADIRARPCLYLGRKSLLVFRSWLEGYRFGSSRPGLPPLPDESEFDGFDAFVCDKYRWHDVGGWASKIAYYHRDDALALDEFFNLVDEFRMANQAELRKTKATRPRKRTEPNVTADGRS